MRDIVLRRRLILATLLSPALGTAGCAHGGIARSSATAGTQGATMSMSMRSSASAKELGERRVSRLPDFALSFSARLFETAQVLLASFGSGTRPEMSNSRSRCGCNGAHGVPEEEEDEVDEGQL